MDPLCTEIDWKVREGRVRHQSPSVPVGRFEDSILNLVLLKDPRSCKTRSTCAYDQHFSLIVVRILECSTLWKVPFGAWAPLENAETTTHPQRSLCSTARSA